MATSVSDRGAGVVASDGDGGVVVAWQELGKVRAQHMTEDGTIAWSQASGVEVCPGTLDGPYMQTAPRVASDGDGGAFVVWHDERNSGCRHLCYDEFKELYVTRLRADGSIATGWPIAGLAVGSAMNYMTPSAGNGRGRPDDFNTVVAADGRGGVIVVWQEWIYPAASHPVPGIHAQRLTADGRRLWGERGVVVCQGPGEHVYPALVADGSGGAFLAWEDSREDLVTPRIYGQHLSWTGLNRWAPNGQPLTRWTRKNEHSPVLTALGSLGVMVGWQAGAADSSQLLAQRVSKSGRLQWAADASVSGLPHEQASLVACPAAGEGVWMAWRDSRAYGTPSIYAQRLTLRGVPAPGWSPGGNAICSTPSQSRSQLHVAAAEGGSAYVTWVENGSPRAVRMTRRGETAEGWNPGGEVLSTSGFGTYQMALIADGERGAIVAWGEGRPPDGFYEDVLVQHLSRTGAGQTRSRDRKPLEKPLDIRAQSTGLSLQGFVPNPSSGALRVSFGLADGAPAQVELFDLAGRRCSVQDVGRFGAGQHVVEMGPAGGLPAGIYIVRLTSKEHSLVTRGVIIH